MTKKKILWVVYDFVQAGGQRYVYEICKALDKEKYDIDILRLSEKGADKNWDKEFYEQPTSDLGCNIMLYSFLVNKWEKEVYGKKTLSKKMLAKVFTGATAEVTWLNNCLSDFLQGYDAVNFGGINAYRTLCITNEVHPFNSIIHILTARFQDNRDIYEGMDKTRRYQFVSSFTAEILQHELEGFSNYHHTYYPLCFEAEGAEVPALENSDVVIAVFTRLSSMKPLDPYFYGLKLLLEQGMKITLKVYGAGSPAEAGFQRQLSYLYLTRHVSFEGHVNSIKDTLVQSPPHLVWFQSNNKIPAGYAALEVASCGVPQLFWDFSYTGQQLEMGTIFPSFTSISAFVAYSKELLLNEVARNKLGADQKAYTLTHYSSSAHIHILEKLFSEQTG